MNAVHNLILIKPCDNAHVHNEDEQQLCESIIALAPRLSVRKIKEHASCDLTECNWAYSTSYFAKRIFCNNDTDTLCIARRCSF